MRETGKYQPSDYLDWTRDAMDELNKWESAQDKELSTGDRIENMEKKLEEIHTMLKELLGVVEDDN